MSICEKCKTMGCTKKVESKMPKRLCSNRDEKIQTKAKELYLENDFKLAKEAVLVEEEGIFNCTFVKKHKFL